MKKTINKYSCQLVSEAVNEQYFSEDLHVRNPQDAADAIIQLTAINKAPSEQMWVIFMNCKMQITGYSMVSSGDLVSSSADCRNVFRGAILTNANSILLTHNHPSGETTPSDTDIEATKKLIEMGKIMGIHITDHIIIGFGKSFHSMRDASPELF